jgi:membrane-associated phospholipid phosphatase
MTVNRLAQIGQKDDEGRPEPAEVRRFSVRVLLALAATGLLVGPFLLLLVLLLGEWDGLSRVDTAVLEWAHRVAVEHASLTQFMSTVSTVLHPWILRLVASAVAVGCMAAGRWRVGLWGLTAAWGSGLIDMMVKSGVARVRPHLPDPVSIAPGYSFPSGHALGALVCLVVVAASVAPALSKPARRWLWSICGFLVVLVGISRVELGVHYPTDVIAGWLLGTAWLAASAAAFDVWKPAPPQAQADDSLRPEPEASD